MIGYQWRSASRSGHMVTSLFHVLQNENVGLLYGGRLGVNKGSPTNHFAADRKRMDLLVISSCVVKLSMDSISETNERCTMAMHKLVRTKRSLGM